MAIAGREHAFDVHRRRVATSSQLWLRALRWSAILARLPFVRMIAVTGSLALHNADAGDDIDFLVIAEDDRVWSCRLNVMLLRAAARRHEQLCFNYFLAERAVALDRRDLYTARELGQMVPVYGWPVYRDMLEANDWMREILPNVTPRQPLANGFRGARSRALAESMLRSGVAGRVERIERERCRRKFARAGHLVEARFDGDCYQDHGHGPSILAAFANRLDGLVRAA